MTTILATIVVLGVLIFVHELGHFLTAKWMDIEVPRFSIGFGPRIIGFKRGETEYVISALPLGGYVKMAGLEEMEMVEGPSTESPETAAPRPGPRPRDFEAKSLPARVLVISAGVLMNFAFAFVTFSAVGAIWGVPVTPPPVIGGITEDLLPVGAEALARIPRGTRILSIGDQTPADFGDVRFALGTARPGPLELRLEGRDPVLITVPDVDSLRSRLVASVQEVLSVPPEIREVVENGAAASADLRAGDRVLRANGRAITTWQEFVEIIEGSPGIPVSLAIERDGGTIETSVTPEARVLPAGTVGRIGIVGPPELNAIPRERVGPLNAVAYGGSETWRWTRLTVQFIGGIFRGRQSARDIGGPIAIAQISGQAARAGLETFLNFMALLSVNLAVLNLLPIPVLDGGHLLFLGIEAVRGRALTLQQRMRLSQVGFVLILALMIFAIGNDVLRWLGL